MNASGWSRFGVYGLLQRLTRCATPTAKATATSATSATRGGGVWRSYGGVWRSYGGATIAGTILHPFLIHSPPKPATARHRQCPAKEK
jgi:hypothetical protein